MDDHQVAVKDQPSNNRLITILSIDGGGIRAVIPATVLTFLEAQLQALEDNNGKENNKEVRLADYFDVIAGTSAGAFISALLAAPAPNDHEEGRPRTAQQIIDFLYEEGPKIFSNRPKPPVVGIDSTQKTAEDFFTKLTKKSLQLLESAMETVYDPIYDGHNIGLVAEEHLGSEILLKDTLTNVVIPAYDINELHPIVFTTRLAKKQNSQLKLIDVMVGSASAPYYFPPKEFEADGKHYKIVDGGLVANNPTMLAIQEATKLFEKQDPNGAPPDYSRYLILSIGTGKAKQYGGHDVTSGGLAEWFNIGKGMPPLVDVLFAASDDIVEINTSFILGQHNSRHNYLRIQDYELMPEDAKIDNTSKKNLDKLRSIGNGLVAKYVAIPDSETGLPKVIFDEDAEQLSHNQLPLKNEDELKHFAKRLHEERRRRMQELYNK